MNALVPDFAIVPRLLIRSDLVIPIPVSMSVRVLLILVIFSSFSLSRTSGESNFNLRRAPKICQFSCNLVEITVEKGIFLVVPKKSTKNQQCYNVLGFFRFN